MTKLFFERQQEIRGELPTTFVYDSFPVFLRNQMELIWQEDQSFSYKCKWIVPRIRLAIGEKFLPEARKQNSYADESWNYKEELMGFFASHKNVDYVLTIVEEMGKVISVGSRNEMNSRMKRAGIGFMHTGENLIRVEDENYFAEVTSPCLSILSANGFEKALKHFVDAYDELKNNKYDDALTDCGQALESIIKTRLKRSGIAYNENDNLSRLLPIVKEHIVVPSFMHEYLQNLFKVIEGLATWRNKEGPHGKSEEHISKIDDVHVRFVINQASANVLFFAEVEFKK